MTRSELLKSIRSIRSGATPGMDGLLRICFKKCAITLLPHLLRIFNGTLCRGYFPRAWRRARAIALRKPGKSSYSEPRSYCPISLLSVAGKLLESIMNRRIMRCLESGCLLSPHQFGFRAGREVLGACCRLADDVVEAFRHRQQVQAVNLDIQVAYDTV